MYIIKGDNFWSASNYFPDYMVLYCMQTLGMSREVKPHLPGLHVPKEASTRNTYLNLLTLFSNASTCYTDLCMDKT